MMGVSIGAAGLRISSMALGWCRIGMDMRLGACSKWEPVRKLLRNDWWELLFDFLGLLAWFSSGDN
jgi:hypothetical protein